MAREIQIDLFKSRLQGGGARANQFSVTLNFPTGLGGQSDEFKFLCKATSLPATTVGVAEAWYRGRKLNLAGDRSFDDWTTTVYNDNDMSIRHAIEQWAQLPDKLGGMKTNAMHPNSYQTSATVEHLDRRGNTVRSYTFHGLWPSEIGTIELDYETNDAIETFDVTWKYNYFTEIKTLIPS